MDYQKMIFGWVASQSGLTGFAMLVIGLFYGVYGTRIIRGAPPLPALAIGGLAGVFAAPLTPWPTHFCGLGAALFLGLIALVRPRIGAALNSALTWGAVGGYLALEFHAPPTVAWIVFGAFGLAGAVFMLLNQNSLTMLLTTLQGSIMVVVGFVGATHAAIPSLSSTFCQLADSCRIVVPLLLIMATVTLYSCQASVNQGNIITGTQASSA